MKKLITYTVTALFATMAWSMAGPEKDAIEAKEKAAWQSFKDKKADEFKSLWIKTSLRLRRRCLQPGQRN